MTTQARNRSRLGLLVVVALLLIAAVVGWHSYSSPLPFNSARWRSGGPVLRYRMKDALRAKYASGELATRKAVDEALGPDDEPGETPQYRYFRLRSPWIHNPWYVRIAFDDHGNVFRFLVSVD
jgi:hypothetical protein